jgi:hypothetical protein
MLLHYTVTATDLGTAISIAQNRAMHDGYSHVSINGMQQTGPNTWTVTMFCANSSGATHRCIGPCSHV